MDIFEKSDDTFIREVFPLIRESLKCSPLTRMELIPLGNVNPYSITPWKEHEDVLEVMTDVKMQPKCFVCIEI